MSIRRTLLLAGLLCAAVAPASAQTAWPSKPVRIVVPYGPGSSPDVLVRLFSDKLGKSLGQTVIVENKPGAGGNTGTDYVAKAAPDGYTFLVSTNGPLVYSTVFNPKLPYDPFKDLAPVTLAGVQPNVCAVSNDMKVDDVKGWVAAMKKDAGQVQLLVHRRRLDVAPVGGDRQAEERFLRGAPALCVVAAGGAGDHAGRRAVRLRAAGGGDAAGQGRQAQGHRRDQRQAQQAGARAADDGRVRLPGHPGAGLDGDHGAGRARRRTSSTA